MFTDLIKAIEEEIKEKSDSNKGYFSQDLYANAAAIDHVTKTIWETIDEHDSFINDIYLMTIKRKARLSEVKDSIESFCNNFERSEKDKEENNVD